MARTMSRKAAQRGQAIVLIALMMVVLLGFVALAIDTARAYDDRRVLQDGVDAAALYAADSYQAGSTWAVAQTNAAAVLARDLRVSSSPNCGAFTTPSAGGGPVTTSCTLAGGISFSVTAADAGPAGQSFTFAAQRTLTAALIQIVGQSPDVRVTATGIATAGDQAQQAVVTTLNGAGCFGATGTSLSITGSTPVSIYGDVVTNGAFAMDGSSQLTVAGDLDARCSVPAAPGSACWQKPAAGTFPPPAYTAAAVAASCATGVLGSKRQGFRRSDPQYMAPAGAVGGVIGSNVVATPGTFTSDPNPTGTVCYFLAPGVYEFDNALTLKGGMVSNILRPPDGADTFWTGGGSNCRSDFAVTAAATGGTAFAPGTYGVYVTSTRTEGGLYKRESAPSPCQSATVGAGQKLTVNISNVPGATGYNIYVGAAACQPPTTPPSTSFGYIASVASGPQTNVNNTACPKTAAADPMTCTLGFTTIDLTGTPPTPLNTSAVAPVPGALLPDALRPPFRPGLPSQVPARGTLPRGDRANYNSCAVAGGGPAACPATYTPGGVIFHLKSGCLDLTSTGDLFLFGGVQYNWVVVAQPATNNCATDSLTAKSNSALVGGFYSPAAKVAISGSRAFQSADFGGLVADKVTISAVPSAEGLQLGRNPDVAPAAPGVRLSG